MIFCRDLMRAYFTHVFHINCKIWPLSAIKKKEEQKRFEIYGKCSGSTQIKYLLSRVKYEPQGITPFDDIEIRKCRLPVTRGTKG